MKIRQRSLPPLADRVVFALSWLASALALGLAAGVGGAPSGPIGAADPAQVLLGLVVAGGTLAWLATRVATAAARALLRRRRTPPMQRPTGRGAAPDDGAAGRRGGAR